MPRPRRPERRGTVGPLWFACSVVRYDETWHRLLEWTGTQAASERLAYQVLAHAGYSDIDPSHPLGGKDGGKDATAVKDGKRFVMAVYFPRGQQALTEIKKKFRHDVRGAKTNGAEGIAFVTNQEIKLSERRQLDLIAKPLIADIYHREKIVGILDSPPMAQIRLQFLDVSYTSPIDVKEVAQEVARATQVASNATNERLDRIYEQVSTERPELLLTSTHPYILDRANALPPSCTREILTLCSSGRSIADTVLRWVNAPPAWLMASPQAVWGLLAEVVSMHGTEAQKIIAIRKAIRESTNEYGYWRARLLLLTIDAERNDAASIIQAEIPGIVPPHPLEVVVSHLIADDPQSAAAAAEAWAPTSTRDSDMRSLVLAKCYLALEDEHSAVNELSRQVPLTPSAGIRETLARLLVNRAYLGQSDSREADLDRAFDLALEARNYHRSWGRPSADAVSIAADACMLRHDWATARRLLTEGSAGATAEEASSPSLMAKAAHVAAAIGEAEEALSLARQVSPFELALVEATIADRENADLPASAAAWRRAWQLATTDEERMLAARGLSMSGVENVAGLSELLSQNPHFATQFNEMRVIAPRENESTDAYRMRLRGIRRTNVFAAIKLAELAQREHQHEEAATILSEAAEVFEDPQLRLTAAAMLEQQDLHAQAIELAQLALSGASPNWSGRKRAWEILHDAATATGDWPAAAKQARNMLGLNSSDSIARWCLAVALYKDGLLQEAWSVIRRSSDATETLEPRNPIHALLQIELTNRFGDPAESLARAANFINNHMDDEQLAANALVIAYLPIARVHNGRSDTDEGDQTDETSDSAFLAARDNLHAVTQTFVERYPESDHFRMVSIDPSDPLKTFADMDSEGLRERHMLISKLREIDAPVGMLASVSGKSYAESIVRRGLGVQCAWSPLDDEIATETSAFETTTSTNRQVVADVAVLHTLALISGSMYLDAKDDLTSRIIGCVPDASILPISMRDVFRSRDSLGMRSSMTILQSEPGSRPTVVEESAEVVERMAATISSMAAIARRFKPRIDEPQPDSEIADSGAWLGLIRQCQTDGSVLWSDDLGLRRLARSEGVDSFGTQTIINWAHANRVIDQTQFSLILLTLADNYFVDLPFDLTRAQHLASASGWLAGPAAVLIGRKWAWAAAPVDCMRLVRQAFKENVGKPDQLALWASNAASGIAGLRISPEVDEKNLTALLLPAVAEVRFSPFCLAGIVGGVRNGAPHAFPGCWERAVLTFHRNLLGETGAWTEASRRLLERTAALPDEIRLKALEIVLRADP